MATKDETNLIALPRFSTLPPVDQRAIVLRADGRTYDQISGILMSEFGLERSPITIRGWFNVNGRLEQAYMDYNQAIADATVKRAKQLAQRLSEQAIATLGDLMKDGNDGTVRLGAAKAMANKFIPDRQVVINNREEDVPSDLMDEGEGVLSDIRGDSATNGQTDASGQPGSDQPNADQAGGQGATEENGERPPEDVAESVLRQQGDADDASVPTA